MAPYNLSDLAVKEIKLQKSHLTPAHEETHNGKFLMAHFVDFWTVFWASTMMTGIFKTSTLTFMNSHILEQSWTNVSYVSFRMFAATLVGMTYFFMSYYMNNGQTFGMKLMKCRISMNSFCARSSFRWAVMSLSLYFTLGLSFKKGTSMLANFGKIASHDHLWQELMRQKEISAPDVRSLERETEVEQYSEAA
jgi:uncharacterized RDD family membrane protein YckC